MILLSDLIIDFKNTDFSIPKLVNKKRGEYQTIVKFQVQKDFLEVNKQNECLLKPYYKEQKKKTYDHLVFKPELNIPCYYLKEQIESDVIYPYSTVDIVLEEANSGLNIIAIILKKQGISPFDFK